MHKPRIHVHTHRSIDQPISACPTLSARARLLDLILGSGACNGTLYCHLCHYCHLCCRKLLVRARLWL